MTQRMTTLALTGALCMIGATALSAGIANAALVNCVVTNGNCSYESDPTIAACVVVVGGECSPVEQEPPPRPPGAGGP